MSIETITWLILGGFTLFMLMIVLFPPSLLGALVVYLIAVEVNKK